MYSRPTQAFAATTKFAERSGGRSGAQFIERGKSAERNEFDAAERGSFPKREQGSAKKRFHLETN
jgi:hypothetical protein